MQRLTNFIQLIGGAQQKPAEPQPDEPAQPTRADLLPIEPDPTSRPTQNPRLLKLYRLIDLAGQPGSRTEKDLGGYQGFC